MITLDFGNHETAGARGIERGGQNAVHTDPIQGGCGCGKQTIGRTALIVLRCILNNKASRSKGGKMSPTAIFFPVALQAGIARHNDFHSASAAGFRIDAFIQPRKPA